MVGNITSKINDLLSNEITMLGYELWGVIYSPAKKSSLLRILIEKKGGVTVDDCAIVARHIGTVLDVEDPIVGSYQLEVSSPGMDRPLFELNHYQRYVGHKIKLRLHVPRNEQRNFYGTLILADEEKGIVIAIENEELCVQLSDIERANIEPEI